MEIQNVRYYEFGEFRLDSRRRILLKNGQPLPLSARIFDLLLVMLQNEGRVLEHDELLDKVWEGMFVEQSNLKKSISALRQILGDKANESNYIKTIPRRGYSFISPVRTLPDEIESSANPENDFNLIQDKSVEIENTATEKILPDPSKPTSFFAQLKKYQVALAVLIILLITTGIFWSLKVFQSKPSFNYSVENIRAKRITSEGNLGNSAPLSPDGNYIVYPVYFGKQGSLWLRQVQTGSVARLTPMMNASFWAYEFSPDGNYVYYILNHADEPNESGLFRIATLGGTPQKLIERASGGLTFAADGSRFAFTRPTEDSAFVEVISAKPDGSDLKRAFLITENKFLWSLRWSPDSLNLLYAIRERSENKTFGYVAETRWDNNADEPAENIVVPKQENQIVISAAWLPDKSSLLLSIREPNADICQLWQFNPVTREKKRITNDDNSYRIIYLSRDGKNFSTVQESSQSEVWLAENNSTDFRPLPNNKNFGATLWAKDNKLIYEGFENQQATLWLTDVEASKKQNLTGGNDGIYLYPELSMDGEFITFTSNRSGSHQIWRMNLDGSNPKQLTNLPSVVSRPSKLLSDKQTLLFTSYNNQTGWILQKQMPDGKISSLTPSDTDLWSVSPDEKLLAVVFKDEKTKKYKVNIQNLNSGETLQTFDFKPIRRLSWTHDGKSLLYITVQKEMDELISQPIDGSSPRILMSAQTEKITSFDTNFDGSKIIVVRSKFKADAFIIRSQEN